MKRSCEKRWLFPALFTADEDKVARVYSQSGNIVDEFVKLDLLSAEFVEVSQALSVVLGDKSSRSYLKAGNRWLESCHVPQVVSVSVVLQLVGGREVRLPVETHGQLEDVEGAGLPIYQHDVGPVFGYEAGGDGNRAARSGFVAGNVDIELKP